MFGCKVIKSTYQININLLKETNSFVPQINSFVPQIIFFIPKKCIHTPNKIISNPKNKIRKKFVTERKIMKTLIDWANYLTIFGLNLNQDIILIYMLSSNDKLL